MRRVREVLGLVVLAAVVVLVIYAILLLRAATVTVAAIPGEVAATRIALIGEITAARKDLDVLMEGTQDDLTQQVMALRADTLAEVGEIRKTADQRVGDTLARVDTALGIVEGVRADLKPVLDGAATLEADTAKTVTDLHPQLLGLVAAGKVTAGEAATTMREIQRATPEIVASVKGAAEHIDAATEASATASANAAAVTGNLAAATKPLPRAVRVGLQIGGPVAQITSYVILMLATMGVL